MLDGMETRLRRLFSTTGGKAVLDALEREATETEMAVEARKAAVARVAEARRHDRAERPGLVACVEEAERAVEAARAALKEATRQRYETGMRLSSHDEGVRREVRGGEAVLRQTADPRVLSAFERVHGACASFHHTANRLLQMELRGEFMKARYVPTNRAEVDALERRLRSVYDTLERLLLVVDPGEEEILRVVREADAAVAAVTLPEGGGR